MQGIARLLGFSKAKFERASINYYIEWLRGYFAQGGRPTHYYAYLLPSEEFLLARADFRLGGECGALARFILVPSGIRYLGGDLGHNKLYFQEGSRLVGDFVPIYADSAFGALPQEILAPFIDQQREADIKFRERTEGYESERRAQAHGSDLTEYLGDR